MAKTESTLDYTKWFQAESDNKGNRSPFVLLSRLFRDHNRKLALSAFYYMLKTSPVGAACCNGQYHQYCQLPEPPFHAGVLD